MATKFVSSPISPSVTALPASPVDGQEIYYVADATNGVVWHLKYRTASASAYKWEFIGGTAILVRNDTTEAFAGGSGYQNSTTNSGITGPDLTIPLSGNYAVEFGAEMTNDNGSGSSDLVIASGRVGSGSILSGAQSYHVQNVYESIQGRSELVLAVASHLYHQYSDANSGTGRMRKRFIAVTPVRVI